MEDAAGPVMTGALLSMVMLTGGDVAMLAGEALSRAVAVSV